MSRGNPHDSIVGYQHDPYQSCAQITGQINSRNQYYWTNTSSYEETILDKIGDTAFSKTSFHKMIIMGNLSPTDALIKASGIYGHEAFFEAFMYMREIGLVDMYIFEMFVFDRGFIELYIACPEHHTVENAIRIIEETRAPNLLSYLRRDLRENKEIKRNINVLKLKGLFDKKA